MLFENKTSSPESKDLTERLKEVVTNKCLVDI